MKKVSFIFFMCIIALSVGAKQKEKFFLTSAVSCSCSPDNYYNRHKAPSKKSLQVYYDGEFVYLQNAFKFETPDIDFDKMLNIHANIKKK